ncbi:YeeE/YedE family protein [Paenibacillus flagellatus]|uniref:YeeE/YedE family protein n=1 Tax=Paenibacillus flagellatus TaxID=2211139 RepID=A0A2V5K724_9BACL|nr:YeeE/YedE family protein [Paenibacillus flagellatus]PYI55231.1 YeeE/YedE family protein [Paenibacillus flagellatus]
MAYTWDVFLLAAVFGFAYGFLLQKADFCFVASVRDWISVKDTRILNGVLVLIAVSLLGWALVLTSGVRSAADVWTVPFGGANLLGGVLFGIGMTIAGGCGSGTLYRCGMGYVQFWIVLLFSIAGNLLFALVYDPWARDAIEPLTVLDGGYTLYSLPLPVYVIPVAIVVVMAAIAVLRFGFRGFAQGFKSALTDWEGNPFKQSHWDIRLVAALIGIVATVQFAVMSNVSITGPETRIGAVAAAQLFGDDFVFGNTYLNSLFADFPKVGLGPEETLVLFLVVGSLTAALLSGSFKLRFPRRSRLPYAVLGGLLMGVSSRIAPGCNIANVITGIGGLSISSVLVIVGMIIGIFVVVAFVFKMPLLLFRRGDDSFGA